MIGSETSCKQLRVGNENDRIHSVKYKYKLINRLTTQMIFYLHSNLERY